MALDQYIVEGDLVLFDFMFPPAVIMWRPISMKATGPAKHKGKKICIIDDAKKSIELPNVMYTVPGYAAPGVGEIKLLALAPNQIATKSTCKGKPILLKGMMFDAVFEPKTKAKVLIVPSVEEDPCPLYFGKGRFFTLNFTHKAT